MLKAPDHRTATVDVQTPKLSGCYADESYKLFSKVDVEEVSPEEARRLRDRYIEWILPFLCIGYDLISIEKQGVSTVKDWS
jgi:hypothetical protein